MEQQPAETTSDAASAEAAKSMAGAEVELKTATEMASKTKQSSLVIIANRLPVHKVKPKDGSSPWQISPGGLVTALRPILTDTAGSWVGWTGDTGPAPEPFANEGINLRPVGLDKTEIESFYAGFSNRTLWPLYHDAIRTPEFKRRWFWPYREVNQRFAEAAAEALNPGDVAWVHDYHLQLVPGMLRKLRPDVKIGFFLHIPFPAEELFARLPWRTEILEGLMGADLIGFQTKLGAANFDRAARQYTSAKKKEGDLEFEGRRVKFGAHPISIDVRHFESLAEKPEVQAKALKLTKQLGHQRKLVLGVDRLDYTKGIDVRLKVIEEVLSRGRFTSDDFVFVQIAVPSRESVDEYAKMRTAIEQLVGRINGEYGEPGRVAVHYHHRNLSHEELAAYYVAADVMLVTPLRDGMNLVAKEYPAARTKGDGVLMLSEFAGASQELKRALLVNPFDIDGVASVLETALNMSETEQRRRMAAIRRTIKANDVYDWANLFLGKLKA